MHDPTSLSPVLRNLLRNGGGGDNVHAGASLTSSATVTSSSSSSSSSSTILTGSDSELLLALQQTLRHVQASPEQLAQTREQLVPLLTTGSRAFAPIWRRAFESKAAEPSGFSQSEDVQIKVQIALFSTRLLRNLAIGDERAQVVLFDGLCGDILTLLRLGSSLAFSTDPELQPLVRSLVQLLSNIVTMNKPLQKALFVKLSLVKPSPQDRQQSQEASRAAAEKVAVLQNLLGSPDPGTVEAVQILLLNCIKSSATNSSALATSPGGRSLLGQLLMLFEASVADDSDEDDEGDEEDDNVFGINGRDREEDDDFGVGDLDVGDGQEPSSKPQKPSKPQQSRQHSVTQKLTVTVGHAIFAHLFEIGLFKHTYRNLASSLVASDDGDESTLPLVTTEQTLLLKTVDAWINAGGQNHPMHEVSSIDQFGILLDETWRLSLFVQSAISSPDGPTMDGRLAASYQALVLVLENLSQLGMIGCEGMEKDEQFREESEGILRRMRTDDFVDGLVELLRKVTEFQPPISPFGSGITPPTQPNASSSPLPAGHAYTSTGLAGSSSSTPSTGRPRLEHLARALIQLLGVLVFQHSPSSLPQSFKERPQWENADESAQIRRVQDRIRERQGLLLVLGATRLDEANPYIREHAIFTLRYLLQGNAQSQDVIRQLQPVGADQASSA